MQYRVLTGEFGDDGLETTHSVFRTENVEKAWERFVERMCDPSNCQCYFVAQYDDDTKEDHDWQRHPEDHHLFPGSLISPIIPQWVKEALR